MDYVFSMRTIRIIIMYIAFGIGFLPLLIACWAMPDDEDFVSTEGDTD